MWLVGLVGLVVGLVCWLVGLILFVGLTKRFWNCVSADPVQFFFLPPDGATVAFGSFLRHQMGPLLPKCSKRPDLYD